MIEAIYTLLIFFFGISTDITRNKNKKRFIILSSLILIFISTFRNIYWGPDDTYNYYQYYEMVNTMDYREILISFWKDPIYHLFAKIVSIFIGSNFTLYLFLLALVFVGTFARVTYRESKNVLLSLLIFICMGIFGFSMFAIRQSLALAFLLLSYRYIKERNPYKFAFLVLIAALFHKTALVFLIAYFICNIKITKITVLIYFGLVVLLTIAGKYLLLSYGAFLVFDERFEGYLESDTTLSIAGLVQLILFLLLVIPYYKKASNDSKEYTILLHMLLLAIVFQSMADVLAEFFRVAWYFKIFLVFLVPNILEYSPSKKTISSALYMLLLFYFIVMGASKHDYAFFWQQYTPTFTPW